MRVSIKVVRELDGSAVHEREVEVAEDGRIGTLVDEIFEKVWPDFREDGPGKYKLVIEKVGQIALA
jgi:hypothetical protein